jgi:hypothetical protein
MAHRRAAGEACIVQIGAVAKSACRQVSCQSQTGSPPLETSPNHPASSGVGAMTNSSPCVACAARYELRFTGLYDRGRGFVFPCDSGGRVDIDDLSDCSRNNYFYARRVIGRELSLPTVTMVAC